MLKYRLFCIFTLEVLLVLSLTGTCSAFDVFLSWDAVNDNSIAGYKVYYKKNFLSFPFDASDAVQGNSPIDVHNNNVAVLNDLDSKSKYYFTVTAYDVNHTESSYSNIVAVNDSSVGSLVILASSDISSAINQAISISKVQHKITIAVNSITFYENVKMNVCDSSITIKGGVHLSNSSYQNQTVIVGSLIVECGTITVDGLIIR